MLRSVTNGSARQLGCSVRRCSGLALPAPVRSTAGGLFGPAGWVSNWGPRIISIVAAPAVMPKPGPLARLVGYAKKEPLRVNLLLATLKTVVADLLVQKYLEEREAVDLRRTAAFAAFGCCYLGAFQYYLYVRCFRWWPAAAMFAAQPLSRKLTHVAGLRALAGQVAFDTLVHYPFIYFPVFYTVAEWLQGRSWAAGGSVGAAMAGGLTRYMANFAEDNCNMFALWIPGSVVAFSAPLWLRMPLKHAISLSATCYLALSMPGSIVREAITEADTAVRLPAGFFTQQTVAG